MDGEYVVNTRSPTRAEVHREWYECQWIHTQQACPTTYPDKREDPIWC